MKTSEVLRKAGDVLRERGHCKGALENESGSVCFNGAINVALHGRPQFAIGIDGGIIGIFEFASTPFGSNIEAVDWNNDCRTTAAEVMHALDAAFVLALQEEGVEPEDVL